MSNQMVEEKRSATLDQYETLCLRLGADKKEKKEKTEKENQDGEKKDKERDED